MRTLLDLRGLVLHSLYSGTDPDAQVIDGQKVNSPGHCLDGFVERYLIPQLEFSRLNDIIAVRDSGNVYRRALYPEYKAHRKGQAPALVEAINDAQKVITRLLDSLGIPQVWVPGVEADDVIAYLAAKLKGNVTILTRDADLIQLASPKTLVIQCGEPRYTYEHDGLSIDPRHVALYKSLVGDSSDGYKGIPGFGPAKFKKLIEQYGLDGLDELVQAVAHLEFGLLRDLSPEHGLLKTLYDNREVWHTAYLLAQLHPELCEGKEATTGQYNRLTWRKRLPDSDKLTGLLRDTGSGYLAPKLEPLLPYRILVTRQMWPDIEADIDAALSESVTVGFDIETTDFTRHPAFKDAANGDYVDMLSSVVTGAGFTFGRNLEATIYLPFGHVETPSADNLPINVLTGLLSSIRCPLAIHNLMFERTVLKASLGYDLAGKRCHDTKVMASHVDENESAGLKDVSKNWFGYEQTRYSEVIEAGKSMAHYTAQHVFDYGADDPWVTAHLHDLFQLILEIEGTWDFVKANEFPAIYPISDGYIAGVTVDFAEMDAQSQEDQATLETSMAILRNSLAENVDAEQSQKGGNNLFEEARRDIRAEAAKDQWDAEKLEQALEKARFDCREAARYVPMNKASKLPRVSFTALSLSKVAEHLGCPPVEKVAKGYLAEYTAPVDWFEAGVRAGSQPDFLARCAESLWAAKPEWVIEGDELNLNSPKQMNNLLYGKLALPIRLRNFNVPEGRKRIGLEDGSPATDKDAVATALAEDCQGEDWRKDALLALQTAKQCLTRASLFYSKYPLWQHPLTGNIHPNINSTGTETRRPSGSNPNPLQWPKRGEGLKFRRCILPNKNLGHDLVVSLDWSSQELRVLAGLSKDKEMLKVYGPDGDSTISLHTAVGAAIAGQSYEAFRTVMEDKDNPLSKKYKDLRNKAKAINFGGAYGIGPTKLARQLMVPTEQARDYLEAKKALYAGVEVWRESTKTRLHRQGYLANLLGSRRHLYGKLTGNDSDLVGHYERAAVNSQIQGLCADLLKRTLRVVWERQVLQRYQATLIAPIYDEIALSCHHTKAVGLILELYDIMTMEVPGLGLSLPSAPSLGINFGDQIEVLAEEDIGRAPTPDEITLAIGKALQGHRYFFHPESNSLFSLQEVAANDREGNVVELSWDEYSGRLLA